MDEYLTRAREAFSKHVLLSVSGLLGGGPAADESGEAERESGGPAQGPPFPSWMGNEGVRCVKAVVQQQVPRPAPRVRAPPFGRRV